MEVEKSCVTFLPCAPCWYVHKPGVQNKWDDNTHTERLGGRVVNSLLFYFIFHFIVVLYITHKTDSVANNKVVYYYLHVKCIRNFTPDGHGTKFSCVGGGVRLVLVGWCGMFV